MIWPLSRRSPLPIDDSSWARLVDSIPALARLDADGSARLRSLVAEFLSRKVITGVAGCVPDDRMRLVIAAQACLPVLTVGLSAYDDFVEIVVYPSSFGVQRRVVDDDGVVHEFDDELSGEAMQRGPVVLAWDAIAAETDDASTNLVIHEFAHKLDMADGVADGCPPMPSGRRARWLDALAAAFDDFVRELDALEDAMPVHLDPESDEADAWYGRLPLDPYAGTDEAEFFSVAVETYFVDPDRLERAFPELFSCFAEYFWSVRRGSAA